MSQGIYILDVGESRLRSDRRRCHPGGDRGNSLGINRAEAIIRVMTSVAGYRNHYPFMSNAPHNGPLTRPEQVASPVHRAFRQQKLEERPCRFPAAKRDREHQHIRRMTRAEWIKEAARNDEVSTEAESQEESESQKEVCVISKEKDSASPDVNKDPSTNHRSHSVKSIRGRILRLVRKQYRKLSCQTKVSNRSVEALDQEPHPENKKNIGQETEGRKLRNYKNERISDENKAKLTASSKTPANVFSRFSERMRQQMINRNAK